MAEEAGLKWWMDDGRAWMKPALIVQGLVLAERSNLQIPWKSLPVLGW